MSRILTENFEGGVNGATITTANSQGAAFTGTSTFSSSSPIQGTLCAFTPGATYMGFSFTARTTVYRRAYLKIDTIGSITWLWSPLNAVPARVMTLRVNSNGTLQIMPGTSGNLLVTPTNFALTAGVWHRIEWAITGTTTQLRLFLGGNVNGSAPDYESPSVTWAGASVTGDQIGALSSSATGIFVDGYAVDDTTWVGPESAPVQTHYPWRLVTATGSVPLIPRLVSLGGVAAHIAYIGDSLTRQDVNGSPRVNASLESLGWSAQQRRVSGHVGRPINGTNELTTAQQSTESVIAGWRGEGFDPHVWVIALGANNIFQTTGTWAGRISAVCDVIASGGAGRVVYWVNQVYQEGSQYDNLAPTFNATLSSTLLSRNDGLAYRIVDLYSLLRNGRNESGLWQGTDDGRHMTPAGYDLRNSIVGSVIGQHSPV